MPQKWYLPRSPCMLLSFLSMLGIDLNCPISKGQTLSVSLSVSFKISAIWLWSECFNYLIKYFRKAKTTLTIARVVPVQMWKQKLFFIDLLFFQFWTKFFNISKIHLSETILSNLNRLYELKGSVFDGRKHRIISVNILDKFQVRSDYLIGQICCALDSHTLSGGLILLGVGREWFPVVLCHLFSLSSLSSCNIFKHFETSQDGWIWLEMVQDIF